MIFCFARFILTFKGSSVLVAFFNEDRKNMYTVLFNIWDKDRDSYYNLIANLRETSHVACIIYKSCKKENIITRNRKYLIDHDFYICII